MRFEGGPSALAARQMPVRYLSRWLTAEQAVPLLSWPAQAGAGETAIVSPLSAEQREQVLTLLGAGPAARQQAQSAAELRLTSRRGGYFVALGPLADEP